MKKAQEQLDHVVRRGPSSVSTWKHPYGRAPSPDPRLAENQELCGGFPYCSSGQLYRAVVGRKNGLLGKLLHGSKRTIDDSQYCTLLLFAVNAVRRDSGCGENQRTFCVALFSDSDDPENGAGRASAAGYEHGT